MKRILIGELLGRMNTEPLRRAEAPTVALVVFNPADTPAPPCRVRFAASFPSRAAMPVTIRDDTGAVVPSRFVRETQSTTAPDLPTGYILWSLLLEFAVPDGLPARAARAFAASFEPSPVKSPPQSLPLREDLPVYETGCHPGELPLRLVLPEDM